MDAKDPAILRHLRDAQPVLWWLDEDPLEPASHPALIGETTADLCIVGAGYTGLWTALLAKERDPARDVVVVEQRETGAGASGRNGGFCSASLTHGFGNGMARFPREMPLIERLARENLDGIEETVRRYEIECDFERTGELRVAVAPWQLRGLRDEAAVRQGLGERTEFLDAEAVRSKIHSPTFLGALHDPDGTAMLDPARLVWGLERACLSLGVRIFESTKADQLEEDGAWMIVHTSYGKVRARQVALATNVFPSLVRAARKYVIPVYDYVLTTEPLSAAQRGSIGWAGREGVSDAGYQFHYYRLTADDSVLWGGYDTVYRFGGRVHQDYEFRAETYATLAAHFLGTFPQLEGIRFTHAWGGAIDTCTRFSPFWGTAHQGRVAYVLGFTGLGVASTRFGAQVMLDLLEHRRNERTGLAMVRRKPIAFPPEPFRYPFIRATQWSIDRADRNEGRRNAWLRLLDRAGLGFDS